MFPKQFYFVFFLALLGGCTAVGDQFTTFMGGEDNAKPPTPLTDIVQQVEIKKVWDKNTGSGTDEQYLKLLPVYYQDRLFVADNDGEVMAIDAATGKVIWEEDTDSPITGGPGAGENVVLVGTGKAEVIALAVDTGEILWRTRVTSEVLSEPKISGNIVIVKTIDGKITGLNAGTGERLWLYDRSVPALTLRGTSSPVIEADLIIAGFDEGRLAAIELLTGKPVWETRVALGSGRSELDRMVDIDSEPVISNGIIYVATFQGRVAALALDSGRILWTREVSSYAGLCVDNKAVYITDDNSEIWALDKLTGASIWKQDKLAARAITAPQNFGNMIAVGDLEGYIHWLDKSTGEIVARKQSSDSKIIAAPVAVNNMLYTYAIDGVLGAYTTDQLNEAFVYETPQDETVTDESGAEIASENNETTEPDKENEEEVEEEEEKGFFGKFWDSMKDSSEEKY